MVKLKLDEKWVETVFKQIEESVKLITKSQFERITPVLINDRIREVMMIELKKPEYKDAIEKAVKELLLDQQAKQLVASFIHRKY
jgi:hypothetical protein